LTQINWDKFKKPMSAPLIERRYQAPVLRLLFQVASGVGQESDPGRCEKFVLAKRMPAIGKADVQKLSINGWSRPN